MFLILLALTLGVALATSALVVLFFNRPIRQILDRIIREEIASGWHRFLLFAIFVVGVSSGVQIWKLEQQTLQGVAWALLVFFVVALIAFAVIRRGEAKQAGSGGSAGQPS